MATFPEESRSVEERISLLITAPIVMNLPGICSRRNSININNGLEHTHCQSHGSILPIYHFAKTLFSTPRKGKRRLKMKPKLIYIIWERDAAACIRQLCCYKVIGRGSTNFPDKFCHLHHRPESHKNPFSESLDKKWFPLIMKYEKVLESERQRARVEWRECCLHIWQTVKGVKNNEKGRRTASIRMAFEESHM